MTKKIIVAGLVTLALGASAYAYGPNHQNVNGMQQGAQQNMMHNKMMGQNTHQNGMQQKGMRGQNGMMGALANLNLSAEQSKQISILQAEMRLERTKNMPASRGEQMKQFVSEKGFDKDAYLKTMTERQTSMASRRAEQMDKIFKILTPDQIKKLQRTL